MLIPDETALQELEAMMPHLSPTNPIAERREFFSGANRKPQTRQRLVPRLLPTPHPQPPAAAPERVVRGERPARPVRAAREASIVLFILAVLAAVACGYSLALYTYSPPEAATRATRAHLPVPLAAPVVAPVPPAPTTSSAAPPAPPVPPEPPLQNYASPALGGVVVPQLTHFAQSWLERVMGAAVFDVQELVTPRRTPLVCIPVKEGSTIVVKLARDAQLREVVVKGEGVCRVDVLGLGEQYMVGGQASFKGAEEPTGLVRIHLSGGCCVNGIEAWGIY